MAAAFGKRGTQVRAFAPREFKPATASASSAPPMPVREIVTRNDELPTIRFPLVTVGLLVLLGVIFMFEMRYAPARMLSAPTLAAYGAIQGNLMFGAGEWWRMFTAPMLHASTGHLIGNCVVLAIVGFMLEPLIGPRWFAGLYAVGGLGGVLMSIFVNDPTIPAVGASGAIMGVLGGAFICGSSARSGPKGRKMQTWALRLILPSLIPIAADSHTDFAGHLGGVLAGIAVGVLILMAWPRGEDRPALGNMAAGIGAVVLIAGIFSFSLFAGTGTSNAAVVANASSGLIPEEELPANIDIGTERARDLLARYPHDPRAHLFRGFAFLRHDHDLADAEEQLRQALAAAQTAQMTPEFEKTVRVLLALNLAYENRPTEAVAMGAPLCDFASNQLGSMYEMMQEKQICN